jgi:hypothetical protein
VIPLQHPLARAALDFWKKYPGVLPLVERQPFWRDECRAGVSLSRADDQGPGSQAFCSTPRWSTGMEHRQDDFYEFIVGTCEIALPFGENGSFNINLLSRPPLVWSFLKKKIGTLHVLYGLI